MSELPPEAPDGSTLVSGPERVVNEQRWSVRLADGSPALWARLLPELADQPALRRRYRLDCARIAALRLDVLAPTIAFGPSPQADDAGAQIPWRLRIDPPGESLASWLERRAPAPIDEACALVGRLAFALDELHRSRYVCRDLHPAKVRLCADGRLLLVDLGLARLDLLSTRTAGSLLLTQSPYTAPEQLRTTTTDRRSDVFSLGVILWQALLGTLPFDGHALLRDRDAEPPSVSGLRSGIPDALEQLIRCCLAPDPSARPPGAGVVGRVLRGEIHLLDAGAPDARCQACDALIQPGQRICLSCGSEAVLFSHVPAAERKRGVSIDLVKLGEEAESLERLRELLAALSDAPLPALDFLQGPAGLYSKDEQKRRIRLPVRLFSQLERQSGERLARRLREAGFDVRLVPAGFNWRRAGSMAAAAAGSIGCAAVLGVIGAGTLVTVGTGVGLLFASLALPWTSRWMRPARGRLNLWLRSAPAALPASDPLVRQLGASVRAETPEDVRHIVAQLALQVQRLVDHRAALAGHANTELSWLTEPLEPLVALIASRVELLRELDRHLAELDEGVLVRALAASEARGEPAHRRQSVLEGLDRLRDLEERRTSAMNALLEAAELTQRVTALGLEVRDPDASYQRSIEQAMAALSPRPDG